MAHVLESSENRRNNLSSQHNVDKQENKTALYHSLFDHSQGRAY